MGIGQKVCRFQKKCFVEVYFAFVDLIENSQRDGELEDALHGKTGVFIEPGVLVGVETFDDDTDFSLFVFNDGVNVFLERAGQTRSRDEGE